MTTSPLDAIRIILCTTTHPGNIGAAARAMKTMGLVDMGLVTPRRFPDPVAVAMASGAGDVLDRARVVAALDDALVGCTLAVGLTARRRDLSHPMLTIREAAPRIVAHARTAPVAVVFGTEMSGLSNAELDKCQLLAGIPANPEYGSLNLAAAVQIVSYELRLAAQGDILRALPQERETATLEEIEAFYRHMEEAMIASGFLDPAAPRRLMTRLRRMFSRAALEKEEVNILRGMMRAFMEGPHREADAAPPATGREAGPGAPEDWPGKPRRD